MDSTMATPVRQRSSNTSVPTGGDAGAVFVSDAPMDSRPPLLLRVVVFVFGVCKCACPLFVRSLCQRARVCPCAPTALPTAGGGSGDFDPEEYFGKRAAAPDVDKAFADHARSDAGKVTESWSEEANEDDLGIEFARPTSEQAPVVPSIPSGTGQVPSYIARRRGRPIGGDVPPASQ